MKPKPVCTDPNIKDKMMSRMLAECRRKIGFLKEVISEAEQRLEEPTKLNLLLVEEKELLAKLKEIHDKWSDLKSENERLAQSNSEQFLRYQYLELARVTRSPESLEVDLSPSATDAKRGFDAPIKVKTALENRRRPSTPYKTRQDIESGLALAEKRRQAFIEARLQAIRMRPQRVSTNRAKLAREAEEQAMERKRKEYMTQQRYLIQKEALQKEESDRIAKRKENAAKLIEQTDDLTQRIKEKVGQPKPISEIHAKQASTLRMREERRCQQVAAMKVPRDPDLQKKVDSLTKGEFSVPKGTTPIKALVEARERKHNPEKFMSPRKLTIDSPTRSAAGEKRLHEVIVKELERLKLSAPGGKEVTLIENDLKEEMKLHMSALDNLGKENDSPQPSTVMPKLEFKLDDEEPGKKRKTTGAVLDVVGESPFSPAARKVNARRLKTCSSVVVDESEGIPKKKSRVKSNDDSPLVPEENATSKSRNATSNAATAN
eukprot:242528_1